MKVYCVYVDKCDYDEYDGIVLVAENKERALEMVKHGKRDNTSYFYEWQGEVHVEEVDLTKEHIVLESFSAG